MHELSVINGIFKVVMRHAAANRVRRIRGVFLEVGKLSDLEERWMQHYFDYVTEKSIAKGATLSISWVDVVMRCSGCKKEFATDPKKDGFGVCPHCRGKGGEVVSGREYYIKNMVAE